MFFGGIGMCVFGVAFMQSLLQVRVSRAKMLVQNHFVESQASQSFLQFFMHVVWFGHGYALKATTLV
jgi:hypothetical protein